MTAEVQKATKIYLASSWRNEMQPVVLKALQIAGFEVYDFKNPKPGDNGFHWSEIDPNWKNWTPESFRHQLENHPVAAAGFKSDFDAMKWADACVLLLPCGRSAHFEGGYFWGAGKPIHILLDADRFEPELMYLGASSINCNVHELLGSLGVED